MISNGENWHYLAVKSLSRLLRDITSNHDGDYYCLNCFHSYRTENKLNAHNKVCENHDYCNIFHLVILFLLIAHLISHIIIIEEKIA